MPSDWDFSPSSAFRKHSVGYPMWWYHHGTLTGAAGGMLRDVLLNEVPLFSAKTSTPSPASAADGSTISVCISTCRRPHAVHRRLLGDPHSDSGGTVRHLPSGTQGRNQTGTQREITNRFRNTGPAIASTTRQFRRPAERDRIAKKNYGSYSAATDDGRLIFGPFTPPTKRSRSCGAIRICNPRTPALT